MKTTGIATGPLSEAEHSRQLRRAIVASTVGTVIEAYDFLLYVIVAPLVFAKLFFPASAPLVGILQAFGIYAVGFIARPVGAALFGHYGDRIGRKVTLIATLLLTGCRRLPSASSPAVRRLASGARSSSPWSALFRVSALAANGAVRP